MAIVLSMPWKRGKPTWWGLHQIRMTLEEGMMIIFVILPHEIHEDPFCPTSLFERQSPQMKGNVASQEVDINVDLFQEEVILLGPQDYHIMT